MTTQELGKTSGKDALENKMTYVTMYGIEKSKNIFYSLIDKNYAILDEVGIKSDIFEYIYEILKNKLI